MSANSEARKRKFFLVSDLHSTTFDVPAECTRSALGLPAEPPKKICLGDRTPLDLVSSNQIDTASLADDAGEIDPWFDIQEPGWNDFFTQAREHLANGGEIVIEGDPEGDEVTANSQLDKIVAGIRSNDEDKETVAIRNSDDKFMEDLLLGDVIWLILNDPSGIRRYEFRAPLLEESTPIPDFPLRAIASNQATIIGVIVSDSASDIVVEEDENRPGDEIIPEADRKLDSEQLLQEHLNFNSRTIPFATFAHLLRSFLESGNKFVLDSGFIEAHCGPFGCFDELGDLVRFALLFARQTAGEIERREAQLEEDGDLVLRRGDIVFTINSDNPFGAVRQSICLGAGSRTKADPAQLPLFQ